jgi:hypothetical protein
MTSIFYTLSKKTLICAFVFLSVINVSHAQDTDAQDTDAALSLYMATLNDNIPPNKQADPAKIIALFNDKGSHNGVNQASILTGKAALATLYAEIAQDWSRWTHVETSRIVAGNQAVWEGVAQGVDRKTGKFIKIPIVFFFKFDAQDKIQELRTYVDRSLVEEQLSQ